MDWEPLDIESLKWGARGLKVGAELAYHRSLGSAMDEARRLAEQGEPEGTVVITEEQTKGRGRFGRAWVSPTGQDLLLAVLLRPRPEHMRYVNMAATLAVSDTVDETSGLRSTIKWPNDVKVAGRKVSGILMETSMEASGPGYAVVGIGLNVNLDPSRHPEVASVATSLKSQMCRRVDRNTVALTLLRRLDELYLAVAGGRSLTQPWSERLETLGRTVHVRWGDRVVAGRASGVDEEGNLIVTQPDGTEVPVVAGEVTLQE